MNETTQKPSLSLVGVVITLLSSILFSTKAIFVKKAFFDTRVDAVTLLALRMAFSLPFYLMAAFFIERRRTAAHLTRRQWGAIFVLGIFGYYLSSLFDFIGLQYISAGLERLLLFLYPTFAVLINLFFFGQPVHRSQWFALLLTYLGVAVAFLGEVHIEAGSAEFWWGSFCVFLCSVTYAFYIAGSGRLIPLIGSNRFTTYALLTATVGVALHFLAAKGPATFLFTAAILPYGLLLALVATVLPTFLLAQGMKRMGSNNVAIVSSIGPVSTILQAHFFLGEKMAAGQIIGTLLVLSGILLLSRRPSKKVLEV